MMKEKRRASLESQLASRSAADIEKIGKEWEDRTQVKKTFEVEEEKEIDDLATMATVVELWQRPEDEEPETNVDMKKFAKSMKSMLPSVKKAEQQMEEEKETEDAKTKGVVASVQEEEIVKKPTMEQAQPNRLSWDDTPVLQIPSAHTYADDRKKPKEKIAGRKKKEDNVQKREDESSSTKKKEKQAKKDNDNEAAKDVRKESKGEPDEDVKKESKGEDNMKPEKDRENKIDKRDGSVIKSDEVQPIVGDEKSVEESKRDKEKRLSLAEDSSTLNGHRDKWNGSYETPREIGYLVTSTEDEVVQMTKEMEETKVVVKKKLESLENGDDTEMVIEENIGTESVVFGEVFDNAGESSGEKLEKPDVHFVYISAEKSEEMMKLKDIEVTQSKDREIKETVHRLVSEETVEASNTMLVEKEQIIDARAENKQIKKESNIQVTEQRKEKEMPIKETKLSKKANKEERIEVENKTTERRRSKGFEKQSIESGDNVVEQQLAKKTVNTKVSRTLELRKDGSTIPGKAELEMLNQGVEEKQKDNQRLGKTKKETEKAGRKIEEQKVFINAEKETRKSGEQVRGKRHKMITVEKTAEERNTKEKTGDAQEEGKKTSVKIVSETGKISSTAKTENHNSATAEVPSQKGTPSKRGSSHALQPNNDMKETFLRTENIASPSVTDESLRVYNQCREDVDEEEQLHHIITKVQKKNQTCRTDEDRWHLIAAGEETCNRKNLGRAPKGKPIKGTREIRTIDLKSTDRGNNERGSESWILIARGNAKDIPRCDEFLEDIDEKSWFSLARGGECHKNRDQTIRKLSLWRGEQEIVASERLTWDIFNMPIQCSEFVRRTVPQNGFFTSVKRETSKAYKLIKTGRLNHVTYCVNDVMEESVENASVYFQDLMEKEHVAYNY